MNKTKNTLIYNKFIKRIFDFSAAFIAILILSPIFLIVSTMAAFMLGTPIIFKRKRPGLDEKLFTIYKFRTMTNKRDENGELLPDKDRLTKFGRFLRASSIDELPELFNILKGDMSIVGPRPLAEDYLPHYTEEEKRRHHVRPGLTGLAQVMGRNNLSWEEKFAYDIEYVDNMSFLMDMKIIFKTIRKLFVKSEIGERGMNGLVDFDIYRQNQNKNKA